MWHVNLTKKTLKQANKVPDNVKGRLFLLLSEIEKDGPVRGNWKNYSKLGKGVHHCHIKSGRPTYVVCWEEVNNKIKIIEVYYVGTHEKAPY